MATSAEPTLKLGAIDEELQCPICLERFTNPRTLPCSHTFCHKCLDHHIQHRTARGEFSCPSCREATKAPSNGAHEFQRNILANNLIEMLVTQEKTVKLCNLCDNGSKAIHMCLDCPETLCQFHAEEHTKLRITKSHLVVPLKELQQGKYENDIRARQVVHCTKHPDEKVRYYCNGCKTPICIDCVNIGGCPHTPAQRQNLTTAGELVKAKMKICLGELQAKLQEKEKVKIAAKRSDEQAEASLAVAKQQVQQQCSQLVTAIRESGNQYLAAINEKLKLKRCASTTLINSLDDDLKRLKKAEEQALVVCNYSNHSELLMSHHTILTQQQKLEKEVPNRDSAPASTVSFAANQPFTELLKKPWLLFGEVIETALVKEIDTKLLEDKEIPQITGIVVHKNDDITAMYRGKNSKLKIFSGDGNFETIFTGDIRHRFGYFTGITLLSSGDMLVCDHVKQNVVEVNARRDVTKIYQVNKKVLGVAMNSVGQLVFIHIRNWVHSLTVWDPKTRSVVLEVTKNEKGDNLFQNPHNITVNAKGHIIVTDSGPSKNSLFIFDKTGATLCVYNPTDDKKKLHLPAGVCVDDNNNIYVADRGNSRIIQLAPDGSFSRVAVSPDDGLEEPCGLTLDNKGNLVVSELRTGKIKVFNAMKVM